MAPNPRARARGGAERRAPPADRPAIRATRWRRLLAAVANSVLVLHRALPDLQRMKLWYSAAASSAPRSVFPLVRLSPSFSWTRGSLSTSDCGQGPFIGSGARFLEFLFTGTPRRRRNAGGGDGTGLDHLHFVSEKAVRSELNIMVDKGKRVQTVGYMSALIRPSSSVRYTTALAPARASATIALRFSLSSKATTSGGRLSSMHPQD